MLLGFSPAGFYSLLLASQIRKMLAYFKNFVGFRQPLINRKLMFWNVTKRWEMECRGGLPAFQPVSAVEFICDGGKSMCSFGVRKGGDLVGMIFALPAHGWPSEVHLLMMGKEAGRPWMLRATGLLHSSGIALTWSWVLWF